MHPNPFFLNVMGRGSTITFLASFERFLGNDWPWKIAALFFFLIPFQFALSPSSGIDLPWGRIFFLLFVVVGAWLLLISGHFDVPFFPALFLTSFVVLSVTSIFWAEVPWFSMRKAAFVASYYFLFLVFCGIARCFPRRYLELLSAAIWGGAAIALVGVLQFASQFFFGVSETFHFLVESILPFFLGQEFASAVQKYPSLLVNIQGKTVLRAVGFFPDPHMFAFYLEILLPFAILRALRWRASFPDIAAAALIGVGILLSFSRGAYLAVFFAGALALLFLLARGVLKKPFVSLFIGGSILLALSSLALPRFVSIWTAPDTSISGRVDMYRAALAAWGEHPLLGVGLGNFPIFVLPSATYREPIYAHNVFLDVAAELGAIGLFLFTGFFVSVGIVLWKQATSQGFREAALFALLIFFIHGLFENPLFSIHVLPILFMVTAIANLGSLTEDARQPRSLPYVIT